MAIGVALVRPAVAAARSGRSAGFRVLRHGIALLAALTLAQGALSPALAHEAGWGPEAWPLSHMAPGEPALIDAPVGVTVLPPPDALAGSDATADDDAGAGTVTTGAAAGTPDAGAPAQAASVPDPATDPAAERARADAEVRAEVQAGGENIGLIEAPDGALGTLPDAAGDPFADSPSVASFAERSSAPARNRMFGPIGHPPVVVELFTAQGCSACPPADDMLSDLADRDDILALSWHVDYWDYLGWADPFAQPDFTRRQQAYAHAWRERAIYTPQMIVGGTDTLIALRPAELMTLIDMQLARPAPVLVTSSQKPDGGFQIELTPRAAIPRPVALLLVRYAPRRDVEIKAGENRGMTVTYRNVVLAVDRVGDWDGRAPLRMTVRADTAPADTFPQDTRHAILAQETGRGKDVTGPILAAIRLD